MDKRVMDEMMKHDPCEEGVAFLESCDTLQEAWDKCDVREWMKWLMGQVLSREDIIKIVAENRLMGDSCMECDDCLFNAIRYSDRRIFGMSTVDLVRMIMPHPPLPVSLRQTPDDPFTMVDLNPQIVVSEDAHTDLIDALAMGMQIAATAIVAQPNSVVLVIKRKDGQPWRSAVDGSEVILVNGQHVDAHGVATELGDTMVNATIRLLYEADVEVVCQELKSEV